MRDLRINIIHSVDKAIDIVNVLSNTKRWMSIHEIVEATGQSKPTAYRLLYTMEQKGVIRYDTATSKYALGYKLIEYGDALLSSQNILQESEDLLNQLYESVKQTVLVGIVDGDSLIYIFKRTNVNEGLVYSSFIGQRRHLLYGALGRVLMAFLDDTHVKQTLDETLPKWTPYTITDKEVMEQRLKKIREEKVCIEVDEATVGVTGVASPIFDYSGKITAVLGVLGPSVQLSNPHLLNKVKDEVMYTAIQISTKLGNTP